MADVLYIIIIIIMVDVSALGSFNGTLISLKSEQMLSRKFVGRVQSSLSTLAFKCSKSSRFIWKFNIKGTTQGWIL